MDMSNMYESEKDLNGLYQSILEMMKSSEEDRGILMEMIKDAEEDRENDMEEREMTMKMMKKMSVQISGLEQIIDEKINEKIKISENEILIKMNEEMEERLKKFKKKKKYYCTWRRTQK